MYPHRIRLRGPWECTPGDEKPRRVSVPCNLAALGLSEVLVVLTRKFGYPGRIDAHERVWLTFDEVKGWASLSLNGHLLGEVEDGSFEADVTGILLPHNRLEVRVRGARIGEVAMEVRATAFLRGVHVDREGRALRVAGTVAGSCDRPLELYFLVDGRHAHYQTIEAGDSFTVLLKEEGKRVRVELVNVSTIWYRVEFAVPSDA